MPLIIVETVQMQRIRYVIDCKNVDHAMDTVVMEEAEDFSQEHLGETIISAREISAEEYFRLFETDNKYLAEWSDEQKKSFINEVIYTDSGSHVINGRTEHGRRPMVPTEQLVDS